MAFNISLFWQIALNVQGDVTATVSIDLPNSVSRGGLPIVSLTKQASLVGTVRFSSPALRNENTSFVFLWTQTGGPVCAEIICCSSAGGPKSQLVLRLCCSQSGD